MTEIYHWLKFYVAVKFKNAFVESIGKSIEDREILAVRIGTDYNPKIAIDCGIHAREWASHDSGSFNGKFGRAVTKGHLWSKITMKFITIKPYFEQQIGET